MPFKMDVESRKSRFWKKVDIRGEDECWPWMGAKWCGDGLLYGKLVWGSRGDQKWLHAHRVAYEFTNGAIGCGLCVCHKCDNPPCCNPKHLFLGTKTDNNADKKQKGRSANVVGELNPRSKLTDEVVKEIRAWLENGVTQTFLAKKYGVTQAQIWRVKNGITWRHVK